MSIGRRIWLLFLLIAGLAASCEARQLAVIVDKTNNTGAPASESRSRSLLADRGDSTWAIPPRHAVQASERAGCAADWVLTHARVSANRRPQRRRLAGMQIFIVWREAGSTLHGEITMP